MVTTPRGRKPPPTERLYIAEWMLERGLSDETLAAKLRVDRVTVTRYRTQQHRLNPDKIRQIANALDVDPPQLWRPPNPNRPSIDGMLRDAPDETVQRAAEALSLLLKAQQR